MKQHPLSLVVGGAASGKSEFAEKLAGKSGKRVLYLATSIPDRRASRSKEWLDKIRRHRSRRPSAWRTEILDGGSPDRIAPDFCPGAVLLDSLTLWISERFKQQSAVSLEKNLEILVRTLQRRAPLIVVSDEAGMGLVPVSKSGRTFLNALGRSNAFLAEKAASVFFVVSGQPIRIK